MSGYLLRQLVTAALTANAVRPVPGYRAAVPSMAAGWLTGELAPHLLALTAADTAYAAARGRSRAGRVLALASSAALAAIVVQSARSQRHVDVALVEALSEDYLDRLSAGYTDLDLSTPLRQLAMPFSVHDEEIEILKDIAYDTEHGKRGLLDVYRQRDADLTNAPVLLHVHGGAWSIGDKEHQGIPLMLHMAARGWVCVTINYRLSPRDPFPAHIVDVKRAIAWIREHAHEYGADPAFLAVTGGSAGGHLAALAALTPNDPAYQPGFEAADTTLQAAAPHYGVYDFAGATGGASALAMRDRFLAPKVLFKDPSTDLAEFERASPMLRVNADAPPFFVVHGRTDSLVDVDQARQFVAALRAVSREPVAYAELPGAQHAFDVFPSIRSAAVVRGVDRFLRFTYDGWVHDRTQP
ncbi:MAG: alpha/beta hydrolase [Nocardioidaceae bacterium]